ncbi:MAG: aspartate--tRNA ligase [Phycisphaerales bacterium]|nr:aspartate--tRNA ligase [Phycisphaerales bacterium]
MATAYRTHTCGELRDAHAGERVKLAGWVHAYRHQGKGLVFVDLRDRAGLTQVTFDMEDSPADVLEAGSKLRQEDAVSVEGIVRIKESPNPKLPTGKIEVVVESVEVLAKTAPPPLLPSDDDTLPSEEGRLTNRYLDLRRPAMQRILQVRHEVGAIAREYFHSIGFLEVETPILCKSTPEGALDFLVPSRMNPGQWYALPQSPQLFKQILMVAGCDRYFQITKCFRDEDLRADRQPEFTQIDLEMSFVTREDVMRAMEGFARKLWKNVLDVDVPELRRMTYREAMDTYGIDRPDLRYGLELVDVSDIARRTDFKVFTGALEKPRGVVKAIRVPGGSHVLTRKITDGYTEFVKTFGAGGVPVTKVVEGGKLEGGVAKFLEPLATDLIARMGAAPGDTILFGADTYSVVTKSLGELRQKVARDMKLLDAPSAPKWSFLWVVDFPMFEWDAETSRFFAMHHPFTAPSPEDVGRFMAADPREHDTVESIVSAGYDMVVNGSEIGGGSIRIHQQDVQKKVFHLLGISEEEAQAKFSFLLEALRFGAPPHGGIAFGLDRLVMHLAGVDNIRDVIAFPKTQTGADLMCDCPSPVDKAQLDELYIKSTFAG